MLKRIVTVKSLVLKRGDTKKGWYQTGPVPKKDLAPKRVRTKKDLAPKRAVTKKGGENA